MAARMEQVVLPGTELEVMPLRREEPVVLRITGVARHGTAYRYDFVYYGLEPGTFDLTKYLRRKDGSSTADLPPLPVTITSVLPAGQVEPNRLELQPGPWLGGYRLALIAGGVMWAGGLAAIVLVRRRKREAAVEIAKPVTVADRLRPLVERAMAGTLSSTERADLERTLLVYWRRRLDLRGHKPAEAFAALRRHPEAGPLIERLETWLHAPAPAEPADLVGLLRPYQNVPTEEAS